VELVLNGDTFDLLKVPVDGRFVEEISEDIALNKLDQCMEGHPVVLDALKRFLAGEKRRIAVIPGNHDMEFYFEGVRRLFCAALTGKRSDPKVRFILDGDRYVLPGGLHIMHGHQYEPIHSYNDDEIMLTKGLEKPILNLPWGSFYVLNVICPLKEQRPYIDHVRPFYPFFMFGLLTDFRFAIKVMARSIYYFFKTRFFKIFNRRTYFKKYMKLLKEDLGGMNNLARHAERTLKTSFGARIVVMGHTHVPMIRSYGPGKVYINAGTWTRMVNLSLGSMSSQICPSYVLVEYENEIPRATLYEWKGVQRPYEKINI
jgi:UDP-2,3-diacylglucosamine pyrophosphatase LpxH